MIEPENKERYIQVVHRCAEERLHILALGENSPAKCEELRVKLVTWLINYCTSDLLGEDFIAVAINTYKEDEFFRNFFRSVADNVQAHYGCTGEQPTFPGFVVWQIFNKGTETVSAETYASMSFIPDGDTLKNTMALKERINFETPYNEWFFILVLMLMTTDYSPWLAGFEETPSA